MEEPIGEDKLFGCGDLLVEGDEEHVFLNEKVNFALEFLLIFSQVNINQLHLLLFLYSQQILILGLSIRRSDNRRSGITSGRLNLILLEPKDN